MNSFEYKRSKDLASADPIPVQYEGSYHLFHLTTPANTIHHPPRLRSSWSRICSDDLVNWTRDKTSVLAPSDNPSAPDADGVWTGSAVKNNKTGNLHLFYTGYNLKKGGKQIIIQAIYDKEKQKYVKAESIEILSDRQIYEEIDFRDPYVFYNSDESNYWMLIATRLAHGPNETRGCIGLLKSTNLDQWTLQSKPLYYPNDVFCPECPELFYLSNVKKWYLVYSKFHAPNPGTIYRISDSPYGPFKKPKNSLNGNLDGRRWYAAKSCPKLEDSDKRIFFGWIGDYHGEDRRWLWGGDMAWPREVYASEDGTLNIKPAVASHSGNTKLIPNQILNSSGTFSAKFLPSDLQPCKQNYKLEFNFDSVEAKSFGILFRSDEELAGTRVVFVPITHSIYSISIDMFPPPLDDFWSDQYSIHREKLIDGPSVVKYDYLALKENQKVEIIILEETLEVFVGEKAVLTYRETNHSKAVNELGFFADDGNVTFSSISLSEF